MGDAAEAGGAGERGERGTAGDGPPRRTTRRKRRAVALALCLPGAPCPGAGGFLAGGSLPSAPPLFPPRGCRRTWSARASAPPAPTDAHDPQDALRNDGVNGTRPAASADIAYFYLQDALGLDEETLWKVTLEAPSALGMTPRNLANKVSVLRRTMDLSDEDVRAILAKQPAVLHYSAERNLAPTILFLGEWRERARAARRGVAIPSTACLTLPPCAFFPPSLPSPPASPDVGPEQGRAAAPDPGVPEHPGLLPGEP